MAQFRGRFGSLSFHKWVHNAVEGLIDSLALLVGRVNVLEGRVNVLEGLTSNLPTYEDSLQAFSSGLRAGEIFIGDGDLVKVGYDLEQTVIPLKATTNIACTPLVSCLVDPYFRHFYSENGINIAYTGVAGDAILYSDLQADISILSTEVDGTITTTTLMAIDVSGCTALTGLRALHASSVVAIGCTALANIVAPEAINITATGCALTAQSIEDLLLSLEATGQSNGTIDISGGTSETYANWSTAAQSAIQNLETTMLWTTNFNGKI